MLKLQLLLQECVNLKQKEDEIAAVRRSNSKRKKKKLIISGSKVIPELLAEQGLSEIKLADGSKVSVKTRI